MEEEAWNLKERETKDGKTNTARDPQSATGNNRSTRENPGERGTHVGDYPNALFYNSVLTMNFG